MTQTTRAAMVRTAKAIGQLRNHINDQAARLEDDNPGEAAVGRALAEWTGLIRDGLLAALDAAPGDEPPDDRA